MRLGRLLPAWLPRRTLLALIGVLVFLGAWDGYGRLTAGGRMAPELRAALSEEPVHNIEVRLAVPPEQFHIKLFQGYGTVSAVRDTTVLLRRVPTGRIEELARFYWIEQIAPAPS